MLDDEQEQPINEENDGSEGQEDIAEQPCLQPAGIEPGNPGSEHFVLEDRKNGVRLEVNSIFFKANFLAKLLLEVRAELLKKTSDDKNGGGLGYI
jgi:hypothetical protein